jgi:hypothetical protein
MQRVKRAGYDLAGRRDPLPDQGKEEYGLPNLSEWQHLAVQAGMLVALRTAILELASGDDGDKKLAELRQLLIREVKDRDFQGIRLEDERAIGVTTMTLIESAFESARLIRSRKNQE